ncbi:MAG: MgtC/SapB family protein [Leptolyngbya sp. SIO4C1]|nr:MgtC/SapB family protein [Leptolyngbya sp. SIO4C1]
MFAPIDGFQLFLRLSCACLAGLIIGGERESQRKSAGLRTHILVCFGSALLVLVSIQTGAAQQSIEAFSRVVQGVITGVGFIGAGTIFHSDRVHGLTSAAAVWVSAALGITAACGLLWLTLLSAVMTWFVLRVLDKFEKII